MSPPRGPSIQDVARQLVKEDNEAWRARRRANIPSELRAISDKLAEIGRMIHENGGIHPKDARSVDDDATAICAQAAQVAAMARMEAGDRSAVDLKKKVRKALGFTTP